MALKHIIWDWNGTLVNDKWLFIDGINSSLKKRELPTITEKQYMDIFTFPVEEYYKKVGFDFANEPFHVAGDEFVKYYGKYFHKVERSTHSKYLREETLFPECCKPVA